MAEKNRASLLAMTKEVTAGIYVPPTSGSQFIALQAGFTFAPNFQAIDNNELKASIGNAKQIQGLEQPKSSFDHYVRHSGVEGTAPGYGPLVEACLGSTSTNGTQRLTAAASTVTVLKLAAGGSDFARGKAVLVKDSSMNGGYAVRPVDSVSTNDLTVGFDFLSAPATGVGAGKCINYAPANTGHPSLSLTLYRGNGGAIEAVAGGRVGGMKIAVAAGELVKASFDLQATKYFFDLITITATNKYLDFTDDDGTFAAVLALGTYRDPHELADAIAAAMDTANPLRPHTVTYLDALGEFKIKTTGTVLSLLFLSGANNANSIDTTISFTHTDKTGTVATTGYTGTVPINLAATLTPSYDSGDPQVAKNNEVLIGDHDSTTCFCASKIDIDVTNDIVDEKCVCAVSGVQDKVFNRRTVEAKIIAFLTRYDADAFLRYRSNSNVKFLYNMGTKSGGNWVAGTVVSFYIPSATVAAFELGDDSGIVTMQITVRAYVDSSGNGEFYLNYL